MPKSNEEFHALMREVLTGSEAAAHELFRDYEPFLLQAIRQRLSRRIRSNFDSMDFAQDVWASFFAHRPEQRTFSSPDDLVKFLTRLAQNKLIDAARKRQTQKNDIRREQSMDDSQIFDKHALAGREPTPSQIVMTKENWAAFLRKQPLVYRRVFILLRRGRTHKEIAEELDIHEKTVQRLIRQADPRAS